MDVHGIGLRSVNAAVMLVVPVMPGMPVML